MISCNGVLHANFKDIFCVMNVFKGHACHLHILLVVDMQKRTKSYDICHVTSTYNSSLVKIRHKKVMLREK